MSLILPTRPRPNRMVPQPIFARNETRPATGAGPIGRNLRPGTRWAWSLEYPPMSYEAALAFDDILSEDETVVIDILQPGLDTGEPGTPLLNGALQTGRTLSIKGVTPGYVFKKGQWLSVFSGGQWFAYKGRAAATANDSGILAVPLRTMIRAPMANNSIVEIKAPKAEGWATVEPDAHAIDAGERLVRLRFNVEERE